MFTLEFLPDRKANCLSLMCLWCIQSLAVWGSTGEYSFYISINTAKTVNMYTFTFRKITCLVSFCYAATSSHSFFGIYNFYTYILCILYISEGPFNILHIVRCNIKALSYPYIAEVFNLKKILSLKDDRRRFYAEFCGVFFYLSCYIPAWYSSVKMPHKLFVSWKPKSTWLICIK